MQGSIKRLITHKGYGFIETDDEEEDIFFHRSQVNGFFEDLNEGDEVKFTLEQSFKGPQANDVILAQ